MLPSLKSTKVEYKSRKFLLTAFSVVLFPILLLNQALTGDQFVNVYSIIIAAYFGGNVWQKKGEQDGNNKSQAE